MVTFGRDCGSIPLEFERSVDERAVFGRQSQVWVRLQEGWRIAAAHLTLLGSPSYVRPVTLTQLR
jgi:hypothetical protein